MKNALKLASLTLLLAGALLAACSPGGQAVEQPTGTPSGQDVEQATDTPIPAPESEEVTLFVGPVLVDCEGEGPQKCMLIKEDPEGDYQYFYDQIEGFEYEEGFVYELQVKKEPVENPPAGASSIKWTVIEVVDKQVSLEGNLWGLNTVADAAGQLVDVLPGTEVTAEFLNGQVAGSAGCNNYFGSYEVSGNSLSIGTIGMTEMFCADPPGLMDQESQYLSSLQNAASYQIEGEQLQIANTDGETILTYFLVQPASLESTSWIMGWYNNGKGGFTSAIAGTEVTAQFSDGTVSGNAGCNNYTGSYEVDGDHITIGPLATTRMFCAEPEGLMDQESQYLAALQAATTYEIKADVLEMFDVDGTRMVSFTAASQAGEMGTTTSTATAGDEALANLEYKSDFTASGTAPLVNGEYREQAAPDSATETVITLTDYVAHGQLPDGLEATAVILVSDPGGSGTFYDLAIVVEEGGQLVNVATTSLGDRVQILNLTIEEGTIVVRMITQGPDDPMCCATQEVVRTYELQGEALALASEELVGPVESDQ